MQAVASAQGMLAVGDYEGGAREDIGTGEGPRGGVRESGTSKRLLMMRMATFEGRELQKELNLMMQEQGTGSSGASPASGGMRRSNSSSMSV